MELTIKSRKLGQTLVFHKRPDGDHYVFLWSARSNNNPYGLQICSGGALNYGSCLSANDDAFERVCRRWYRQRLRRMASFHEYLPSHLR